MRFGLLLFLFLCLPASVEADDAVEARLKPGGRGTVASVVDGDTVLLTEPIDGADQVRLVGLQAPKLPLGRKGFREWPLARASKAMLERLVLGKPVRLAFGGRRMDRHGRLLAHLFVEGGGWAQGEMLRTGMARVYTFPDNRTLAAEMLALEAKARAAGKGIWGLRYYAIRDAAGAGGLLHDVGTFQLVEGHLVDAAKVKGRVYLNFGTDWRTDMTVSIAPRVLKVFSASDLDPLTWKGQRLRVRGWLRKRNGPLIEATHPEQIEVLGN